MSGKGEWLKELKVKGELKESDVIKLWKDIVFYIDYRACELSLDAVEAQVPGRNHKLTFCKQ
jgi:hypothetical protein